MKKNGVPVRANTDPKCARVWFAFPWTLFSLFILLYEGRNRRLTLVSAPAGFGKTTLISEWVEVLIAGSTSQTQSINRVWWLSLDDGDNDYARFLTYFIGALQAIEPGIEYARKIGEEAAELLALPQPPSHQQILTPVLNQISDLRDRIILVLDDYHFIETEAIHTALAFVMEHMPAAMHLVITTRQDPPFALARMRSQGEMNEVRAADLRFSAEEVSEFMQGTMDLHLTTEQISTLEARTEGWAVGLQLAAMSLHDRDDPADLIETFAGSHRHVTDFLVQEVLARQPEKILKFLLQTSILNRLTGPLCDAITQGHDGNEVLQNLEQANMFVIPLDEERRWYRYHHLFADLLRQRSQEGSSAEGAGSWNVSDLHIRASEWFEANDLEVEAFHHAAAANDVARAGRLIEGGELPLPMRGVVAPVLDWLASLPTATMDERPSLWVTYAMTAMITGDMSGVEEKLEAAEAAIRGVEPDDKTRDLTGRIADMRGHDRGRSPAGGDHIGPIAPRSRVSESRQLELPHLQHVEAGGCLRTPGGPRCCRQSVRRGHVSQQGVWKHLHDTVGHNRSG